MTTLFTIVLGIIGVATLVFTFCFWFKYNLLADTFNKWAGTEVLGEKKWNSFILHAVAAFVCGSVVSGICIGVFLANNDNPEMSRNLMLFYTFMPFVATGLYAYLLGRLRFNKKGIPMRATWVGMLYGVLTVSAIVLSLYLAIQALMWLIFIVVGFVILKVIYWFLSPTGRTIKATDGGLFSTEKELDELYDGTYRDKWGRIYIKRGDKLYPKD